MNDEKPHSLQVKKVSLVDAVVEQMIEAVKNGRFKSGEKIPSEKVLTKEFGVSRTTLREAFKRLEYAGALSIKQGDGTYLLDNGELNGALSGFKGTPYADNSQQLKARIRDLFSVSNNQLSSYIEAREILEAGMSELLVERIEESELQELSENLTRQKAAINKPGTFYELDTQFHKILIRAGKNNFLFDFWLLLEPYTNTQMERVAKIPGMAKNAFSFHKKIYNALVRQDAKQLKMLLVEHMRIMPGRLLSGAIEDESWTD